MTARLAHIFRHPVKSHGREALAAVTLSPDRPLPWDRRWAVAHEAARLPEPGGWAECVHFSRGSKAPALMAIEARLDEDAGRVTLSHPERPEFSFRPDTEDDLPAFLDWVRPLCPPGRAQPQRIVTAGARGMTDTDYPSVSILSLASNRALSGAMGVDLSILRWRGNLWIEGTGPWAERDWIGREIRIGEAVLRVTEPITRCKATTANPATGRIDADTLAGLRALLGHQEFGVYARVVSGGRVATGDTLGLPE